MSKEKNNQKSNEKLANVQSPGFTEETEALAHNYFILCAYERVDIAICNDLFDKLRHKYAAREEGIDYLAGQIHTINEELGSIKQQKDYIWAYLTSKMHDKGREYFLETLVHNYTAACEANKNGPVISFQDIVSAFSNFFEATKPEANGRDVIEHIEQQERVETKERISPLEAP